MKRAKTPLQLAKAQYAGGVPWGEVWLGRCSLFVCQGCGGEYHLRDGEEPCAFCDDCKNDVLDVLAEAIVKAAKSKPRRKR